MVLWMGTFVALIQTAYYLLLAVIANNKIAQLTNIGLTSQALHQSLKDNLTHAVISAFFILCFGYVLFYVQKQNVMQEPKGH